MEAKIMSKMPIALGIPLRSCATGMSVGMGLGARRIGRINLGNLPVGQWRFLTPWERFD